MARTAVALLALVALVGIAYATFGDRVIHTAFAYKNFPLTRDAAESGDWRRVNSNCIPGKGVAYVHKNGVASSTPAFLYFAQSNGALAGFQLRRWVQSTGSPADRFWEAPSVDLSCSASDCSDIFVQFRDPSTVCGTNFAMGNGVGDRIVVGSKQLRVPLNATDAKMKGWMEGDCIPGMGIHYSMNLGGPLGKGNWNASSLFPIMPMYDAQSGNINAILIANPHLANAFPLGWWEGPIPNILMCKNWCSTSGCGFVDTLIWSTMHFWFRDHSGISCTGARCSLLGMKDEAHRH